MTCYATGDAWPCSLFPDLCKCSPTGKESLHVQATVMTLNERVAKVKGWNVYRHVTIYGIPPPHRDARTSPRLYDWSGSIADAWELVEELKATGRGFNIFTDDGGKHLWTVECWTDMPGQAESGEAPTATEAICLAYLAVMEDKS